MDIETLRKLSEIAKQAGCSISGCYGVLIEVETPEGGYFKCKADEKSLLRALGY